MAKKQKFEFDASNSMEFIDDNGDVLVVDRVEEPARDAYAITFYIKDDGSKVIGLTRKQAKQFALAILKEVL